MITRVVDIPIGEYLNRHGFHVTELIEITGERVWALDRLGEASGFSFFDGKWVAITLLKPPQRKLLALPVRSSRRPKVHEVKLRSTPLVTVDSDVEMMIRERNFFVKNRNDKGEFPNDFVDNGDGTITDRTTGLVWEKAGSSNAMRYRSAKRYVSRLNKERSGGYNDWRIPTTEELASLLERDRNNEGLHIAPLFDGGQKAYWTSDTTPVSLALVTRNNVIDFSKGSIDSTNSKSEAPNLAGYEEDQCFMRAVRSIE
jgi:hypothetical protein